MANIAFFHNALGKTDGVSLEVDKWRDVLQSIGHKVYYCAGNDDVESVHCIPELSFMDLQTKKLIDNATVELKDFSEAELEKELHKQAEIIEQKLIEFITTYKIELLVPNNLLSVGYHLSALIALAKVIEKTGLQTIAHNHDFYFEDSGEVNPTCQIAWDILDRYAPPQGDNIQNLTINKLAQKALKKRKNIDSIIVPNVFDFNQEQWKKDEYNNDFRKSFGIDENDIVFLQATRVMSRKGIELAIDVVAELNKEEFKQKLVGQILYNGKKFTSSNKIILLCAGRIEIFGTKDDYVTALKKRAEEKNVEIQFIGDYVKHSRGMKNNRKLYSLWDSYVHSDIVTYPSWWEGWGNQFIEAIFAKLPVVLFEYPVYTSDLKDVGFVIISLGNTFTGTDKYGLKTIPQVTVNDAAQKLLPLLLDNEKRTLTVEHNYNLAKKHFSYDTLKSLIYKLLR